MKLIDIREIRKRASIKRARGSIIDSEERKLRHERAQHTPYLDRMLEKA